MLGSSSANVGEVSATCDLTMVICFCDHSFLEEEVAFLPGVPEETAEVRAGRKDKKHQKQVLQVFAIICS